MPLPEHFARLRMTAPLLYRLAQSPVPEVRGCALAFLAERLNCAANADAVDAVLATADDATIQRVGQEERLHHSALVACLCKGKPTTFWGMCTTLILASRYPLAAHIIATVVIVSFIVLIGVMILCKANIHENAALLLGSLSTAFGGIINYYFDTGGLSKNTSATTLHQPPPPTPSVPTQDRAG